MSVIEGKADLPVEDPDTWELFGDVLNAETGAR
jgi:hypothetical protein